MKTYIPIICYVLGVATGVIISYLGYLLGFKASYEIRSVKSGEDQDNTLFPKKDPAEFKLLEEQDKKDKESE